MRYYYIEYVIMSNYYIYYVHKPKILIKSIRTINIYITYERHL